MTATIKETDIRITGNIPDGFMDMVRKYFGPAKVAILPDEEYIPIEKTEWFQTQKNTITPQRSLRVYREIRGMTQAALAEKLGIMRHHITEMETGKRAISREMAKKLSGLFEVSVERFI